MIAKAISKYNRISPKKTRLLTRPLAGKTVQEAYAYLNHVNKRAAYLLRTVLTSAVNNALKKDPALQPGDLLISRITADSGPSLRRYRAASMGRASLIRKRTSHLTIHLDIKKGTVPAQRKEPAKKGVFKKQRSRRAAAPAKKPAAGTGHGKMRKKKATRNGGK